MAFFSCPYLGRLVELNEEREQHIRVRHPELLPERPHLIASTLAAPDRILRRETASGVSLPFCRWYNDLSKYVIVVVVSDSVSSNWIVTAYVANRLPKGETVWQQN